MQHKDNLIEFLLFAILINKIHNIYYDDLEDRYIDDDGNMYKNIQDLPKHLFNTFKTI